MTQLRTGRPRRGRPVRRVWALVAVASVLLAGCTQGDGVTAPSSSSGSPASPDSPGSSPAGPDWPESTPMIGAYLSRFSSAEFDDVFGRYPDVETVYLDADRVTTPDLPEIRAALDHGVSPVIALGWRNGPFTRAEIAAWSAPVRAWVATFVAGLRDLTDYAAERGQGARVYFADEHEAVVKINQGKYTFSGYGGGVPTVGDSAAAWNRVMGYVAKQAPEAVRTYWYGGSGANEDVFAAALQPGLIQLATMDIYRWRHDSGDATPEQEWGAKVEHLREQPWMRTADGGLKPWAVTEWGTDVVHGDAANATFVSSALSFFARNGALFAVYFDRVDSNDATNDFVIDKSGESHTFRTFDSAVQETSG